MADWGCSFLRTYTRTPPKRDRQHISSTAQAVLHMSRPRDRRVRAGNGGGPSRGGGGGLRDGTGDSPAPAVGVAGGRDARVNGQQRLGHLRYSPGEERAMKTSIEKALRLKRLEQVRQQSRQHAAAVREEYRQRRKENKRAAVRESKVCGILKALAAVMFFSARTDHGRHRVSLRQPE